jgi:ADP-heptose:LPS heptosyltransferase
MFCTDSWALARQLPLFLWRSCARSRSVTFLHHREALGDTLMLSAHARSLKKARPELHIAVVSRRPELFFNNPYIAENRGWHLWRSGRTVRAKYGAKDLAAPGLHALEIQWRSLWRELAATNFPGAQTPPAQDGLYPELFLSAGEIRAAGEMAGIASGRPVVLLSSGGKLKPTHNREWGLDNYRALAEALAPHARLIQISGEETLVVAGQPLEDMRNIPVRRAAALFSVCDAMLVQEGGLMHVARAVNAPCVTIFGGYVLPEQTGYPEQTNFFSRPECSPCISRLENCPHMKCMVPISPRAVLAALVEKVERRRAGRIPSSILECVPSEWIPPPFVDREILRQELAKTK